MADQKPETVKCRGCNMPITFIKNHQTGAMIPAQAVRTIYQLRKDLLGESYLEIVDVGVQHSRLYISHFETCPEAKRFSSSTRKGST